MCLECAGQAKEQKKYIRDLEVREDGYVWLWKIFNLDFEDNLVAQFQNYAFYEGKNTAEGDTIYEYDSEIEAGCQYEPGFHCLDTEEAAMTWGDNSRNDKGGERIVVPVQVRRTWVTTVGYQDGAGRVFVCKHIII